MEYKKSLILHKLIHLTHVKYLNVDKSSSQIVVKIREIRECALICVLIPDNKRKTFGKK